MSGRVDPYVVASATSGALSDPMVVGYDLLADRFQPASMSLRFLTSDASRGLQATLLPGAAMVGATYHQSFPLEAALGVSGALMRPLPAGVPVPFSVAEAQWDSSSGFANSQAFLLRVNASGSLPQADHYSGQAVIAFMPGL
ncbi:MULTISPECIES: hypothetical protein [unclassified Paludibacterium]|uniref:hypothetical protein n=1 Tax=unclassified Paludibacterium TaxID=2618429 RepID=UPI001C046ADD|nr:hypothetical protein [Paludibacterium sp. B53371]